MRAASTLLALFLCLVAIHFAFCTPARAEVMDEPARLMDFADGLFARGAYELAEGEYIRLLKKHPDFESAQLARFRLAECFFLRNMFDKAVPHYNKVIGDGTAVELVPAARLRLGACLYFLHRFDEAIAALKPLTADGVDSHYATGAAYFLGRAYIETGNTTDAKALLETAAKGGDYAALAAFCRANLAVSEKNFSFAAKYYRITLEREGDTGLGNTASLRLANSLLKAGAGAGSKEARRVLMRLVKLDREFPSFTAALHLAAVYTSSGEHVPAIQLLESTVAKFPTSVHIPKALLQLANSFSVLSNWQKAEKFYFKALNAPKTDNKLAASAEQGYLRSLLEQSKFGAILRYRENLGKAAKPAYPSLLVFAEALDKSGAKAQALAMYSQLAIEGPEPHLRYARLKRAILLSEVGDLKDIIEASTEFASTYKNDPQASVLLSNAGDAALKAKRYGDAQSVFSIAIESAVTEDKALYARYRRAVARYYLGEKDGMAQDLTIVEGSALKGAYLDRVLMMLGDYEQEKGSYPKAIIYFSRLVSECPGSPRVVAARMRLGACYYSRKMFDRAALYYLQLIRDGFVADLEDDVILWTINHLALKAPVEAEFACKKVIENRVDRPVLIGEAMYLLAELLQAQGKFPEAKSEYSRLLRRFPKAVRRYSAKLGIAKCCRKLGDAGESRRLLHDLIGEATGRMKAVATLELADLEFAEGRKKEALREYLIVAILEEEEQLAAPALIGAVRCCVALGKPQDAAAHSRELIKRFPNSPYRKEAEKHLKGK